LANTNYSKNTKHISESAGQKINSTAKAYSELKERGLGGLGDEEAKAFL